MTKYILQANRSSMSSDTSPLAYGNLLHDCLRWGIKDRTKSIDEEWGWRKSWKTPKTKDVFLTSSSSSSPRWGGWSNGVWRWLGMYKGALTGEMEVILGLDVFNRDALERPQRVSGTDAPCCGTHVRIGREHELQ